MTKYVVYPLGTVDETYVCRHHGLDEAKTLANKMATEYHIEVLVLKVIGGYKPFVEWEPAATDPDAP